MDLRVREVRPDDAAELTRILNPIIEAGTYTVLDTPLSVEAERRFIESFPARGIFHVAEDGDGGALVGFQDVSPFADYTRAFESVDVIALPTSPSAAFRLGERVENPLQMYLADVFTVSAPLAGLPAISVPCGYTSDRLPVGLQLTGRAWDEATILRIANAYEQAASWMGMHPDL